MKEPLAVAIQPVQPACQGAYPDPPVGVLAQTHHAIIRQAGRVLVPVTVMDKPLPVKTIQPPKIGPDPEFSLPVQHHAYDNIAAQTIFIMRIMQPLLEAVLLPVEIHQAAAIAPNPNISMGILHKAVD